MSALVALALSGVTAPAPAQDYPAGNITAIVALGAGGSMDVITRLYGQKLSEQFGKPFIVENRGAAAGNVAAEAVARAHPDGQTLLVASSGVYSINGTYFKSLPYDGERDLAPIALYVKIPFILVASAQSPIGSLPELVKIAKEQPGKLTFASTGVGLAPHLAGELLKMKLAIDLTHVPYKGSMAQALSDVMARHVDLAFADPSIAIPLIKEGKLKAFGASSLTRLPQMPDLPTIAEAINAPDFEAVSWHVIAAPAKTPKPIVDRLYGALVAAFKDPAIAEKIQAMGLTEVNPPLGPEATKAYIASEKAKWGALLERLHLVGSQ
ncbi:tripartite tricarboxylate transporter substrate binding protein [Microbacteriaceae bacterium K1510]|nr:tripartite tricarboxylate transporter substrate binding protein [Microbacteriaceae bacterium K1510]